MTSTGPTSVSTVFARVPLRLFPLFFPAAAAAADDGSGDVVVRLYEAAGARTRATLTAGFPLHSATACDLLERPLAEGSPARIRGAGVELGLRPFEIVTLRLARSADAAPAPTER